MRHSLPVMDPTALRAHYRHFLRDGRTLLTGHSHQAWPDVAREALCASFDDAALHVDDKWQRAFEAADAVRAAIGERLGARPRQVALAQNTHELVARLLSAIPAGRRRHLLTTAGEFHSVRRQLGRLREEGVEVESVEVGSVETLAERLAARVRGDTGAVLVSCVLFETSSVVPHLHLLAERCAAQGALLLIDAYHAYNVLPLRVAELGPGAFVVGGGYKYAQYGEGVCFMTVPEGCDLRPVYTGWFAEFARITDPDRARTLYGSDGADRFAGATYDPASHYRARAVARFFDEAGLTVAQLRETSLRQTARIIAALDRAGADLRTPREDARRGGFVSVRLGDAAARCDVLRARGVYVDHRGDLLRIGPAPYTTDAEIDLGVDALLSAGASRG